MNDDDIVRAFERYPPQVCECVAAGEAVADLMETEPGKAAVLIRRLGAKAACRMALTMKFMTRWSQEMKEV